MVVINLKKKILWGGGLFVGLILATIGTAVYFLTRPLQVEIAQDPNAVEAHEANRKLKLLNEAQTEQRQGFVRFSEVEINSFLDGRYGTGSSPSTNGPLGMAKVRVRLSDPNISFITWHQLPIFGFKIPFVWQREVSLSNGTNGWSIAPHSMRVGDVPIPKELWSRVDAILGKNDSLFEERKTWLSNLPLIQLAQNEQSKSPELRLYTYVPQENNKRNEIASK